MTQSINRIPPYICLLNFVACLVLSACSSLGQHTPMEQGNVLNPEKFEQIRKGMSKPAVQNVLGTPVLEPLDDNQWHYIYTRKRPYHSLEIQRATVFFSGGNVISVEKPH